MSKVTAELVKQLRNSGASESLIRFAEDSVDRYSQRDMDRATSRAFWMGVTLGIVGITLSRLSLGL